MRISSRKLRDPNWVELTLFFLGLIFMVLDLFVPDLAKSVKNDETSLDKDEDVSTNVTTGTRP